MYGIGKVGCGCNAKELSRLREHPSLHRNGKVGRLELTMRPKVPELVRVCDEFSQFRFPKCVREHEVWKRYEIKSMNLSEPA